jgi:hypothetical protein
VNWIYDEVVYGGRHRVTLMPGVRAKQNRARPEAERGLFKKRRTISRRV